MVKYFFYEYDEKKKFGTGKRYGVFSGEKGEVRKYFRENKNYFKMFVLYDEESDETYCYIGYCKVEEYNGWVKWKGDFGFKLMWE